VRSGEAAEAGGRIGEDMATQTRGEAPEKRSGSGRASKRETRTTPAVFFRQMVSELRKVIWPTRSMLVTYTVVTVVFVIFMVIVVTSLDYGFTKLIFALFG
jgi:preprotein translocase subunit SecE